MRRLDDGSRGVATLPDVAERAGVSTATAARALGGYGSVRETTRQRVLDAAEALGYRANVLARSMVTGSSHTIGVVISDIENPFFRKSLRGITDTARSRGFEVLLANTDEELEKERSAVSLLEERRVDGLVICPADAGDRKHLREVIAAGTPVVLLDRRVAGLAADTVGIDNRKAARLATERLLALGHKRIAIVTGGTPEIRERLVRPDMKGVERLSATTVGSRAAGYRDAMTAAGLTLRPEYLSANGFRREDAVDEVCRLMDLAEPPTAILAFDSIQSLGALQCFRERGIRCPEEVSLLGFDDAEWADVVEPPLTVVTQPMYEIGVAACERLLDRISGEQRSPVHDRLPTVFIERSSLAPPARS
ncbi:transcriptional regulator, LacI family [Pedococcus cremeus]|uniref:Transcriptional regulator, LacI family n=1 Tax=Pedococcus cremeus TaxID=587636 RepID=A0A1H9VNS1_9MICO|nr:LacI family DNA-binding transcriptional regulator [Pedococcus cremeus]SES23440.1 transcriptional regulator, LacI family [Pedococcus cremeus]